MTAYNMQGTPTLLLLDRKGKIRKQYFGREQDIVIGAEIMALVCEGQIPDTGTVRTNEDGCDENGCAIPGLVDIDANDDQ